MIALLAGSSLAATLSGSVVDQEGRPLDDVTVYVFDTRLANAAVLTNADGAFSFAGLPDSTYRLWAIPEDGANQSPRFYPSSRSYCSGESMTLSGDEVLDGLVIELPAGAVLRGRLVDSTGQPVPDADLRADGASESVDGLFREATTDDGGWFELAGLDVEEGPSSWTCKVDVDLWPRQYLGPTYDDEEAQVFEVEAGDDVDAGDHVLLDGIVVSGTVGGPGGPIEGASVHVYSSSQVVTVGTEADGSYLAMGLPPGSVLAWASAEGHALTYYPDVDRPENFVDAVEEGQQLDGMDLDLPAEAVFQAQLLGAGDLSGVTLLLYNSERTVGVGDRANADGSARIGGLQGGDYTLMIYASDEGYADDFARDEDGEPTVFTVTPEIVNDPVDLELVPQATASGVLVDDAGDPIYGAYLLATPRTAGGDTVLAVTERDGSFELVGMPGGKWDIEGYYVPYCSTDPGYVRVYWPGEVNSTWRTAIELVEGTEQGGLDLVLPRDDEHDLMGDAWERIYGLDTTRDDSAEDPDVDGYTNLEEYLLGSNPVVSDSRVGPGCGCRDRPSAEGLVFLFPALLGWGRRRRAGGQPRRHSSSA